MRGVVGEEDQLGDHHTERDGDGHLRPVVADESECHPHAGQGQEEARPAARVVEVAPFHQAAVLNPPQQGGVIATTGPLGATPSWPFSDCGGSSAGMRLLGEVGMRGSGVDRQAGVRPRRRAAQWWCSGDRDGEADAGESPDESDATAWGLGQGCPRVHRITSRPPARQVRPRQRPGRRYAAGADFDTEIPPGRMPGERSPGPWSVLRSSNPRRLKGQCTSFRPTTHPTIPASSRIFSTDADSAPVTIA